MILFPVILANLSVLGQLCQRILAPARDFVNSPLQALFAVLEGFIFFVPETVDPRDDNPELADAEFVQQSDVHAVNQTAVEGVKQVLESLFVGLSDLERSGDVLQVEKLELLEDLLRYGQIGVGLVKVTGLLLVLTYLQHLLLAYLLDIHQVVLYLRVVVIKQVMRHLQQPGVYSVN